MFVAKGLLLPPPGAAGLVYVVLIGSAAGGGWLVFVVSVIPGTGGSDLTFPTKLIFGALDLAKLLFPVLVGTAFPEIADLL